MFFQEYDAEKERNARENALLLNKAEEHRLKGRKLSEELSNLKQNHVQTKQEVSPSETPASGDNDNRLAFKSLILIGIITWRSNVATENKFMKLTR